MLGRSFIEQCCFKSPALTLLHYSSQHAQHLNILLEISGRCRLAASTAHVSPDWSVVQRPHPPLRVSLRELLSTVHHFWASLSSSKQNCMELPGSPGTSNSWHLLLFCSYETSLSLKSVTT
ncbi:hypothetical protein XELAEV_18000265mg [Xenopus laevis]|uniref:Uncharacterized protein n=1 Tax=Xenopus laevis TaxID=8355 RepID=A0A974GYM0_XENLA|nr:hypothetical protein XELAEV_18000265mg [Xenopus laevis]